MTHYLINHYLLKRLLVLVTFCTSNSVFANATDMAQQTEPVQVGKHVAANMDAMSMILSLLMVLAVIVVSSLILKRFQNVQHNLKGLKIVTSLHLGAKEKLVVVQSGEQQLLLGVTAQQITLLDTLDKPIVAGQESTVNFSQHIAKVLKPKTVKNDE